MTVAQWRLDVSDEIYGWLVISGLATDFHQQAMQAAYARGFIINGPVAPLFDDEDFGVASRYPILRVQESPTIRLDSPLDRSSAEA